VADG